MNNGNGQVPQGPQNPQAPQYAQGPQAPQPQQAPQYAPQPQYPQGQYPQYGAGAPLPPKKKTNGWLIALLSGCGCLLILAIIVVVVFGVGMVESYNEHNKDRTTPLIEELNLKESYVMRDGLDSLQIKELVYIGMPKDSVLITLGKPDDYLDANWGDYVAYNLNDSLNVQIDFTAELADRIEFIEIVPERFLEEEETDSI